MSSNDFYPNYLQRLNGGYYVLLPIREGGVMSLTTWWADGHCWSLIKKSLCQICCRGLTMMIILCYDTFSLRISDISLIYSRLLSFNSSFYRRVVMTLGNIFYFFMDFVCGSRHESHAFFIVNYGHAGAHTDLKYIYIYLVISQNQVDVMSFLHIYSKLPSATDQGCINRIFPVINFFFLNPVTMMEYFENRPLFWQSVIDISVLLDSRYVSLVVFLWREPLQNVTPAKCLKFLWKAQ